MTRIVVGVDGSEHSARALRRAMEEASLRSAQVEAVYAFEPPKRSWTDSLIGLPYGRLPNVGAISPDAPAHHPPTEMEEAQDHAEASLAAFVDEALKGIDGARPQLVAIADGHPAEALIQHARGAALLVIGTRGLGGFTGMLVGSVAHQCIQHARCPMLILPPED